MVTDPPNLQDGQESEGKEEIIRNFDIGQGESKDDITDKFEHALPEIFRVRIQF